ncbi:MAG: tRNA (adenine-N1)-methyltransferase [Ferrimicrobium sp.]
MTLGAFAPGDYVLVVDHRDREVLVQLVVGEVTNTHRGRVVHDEIIGRASGSVVATATGKRFLVVAPSFSDIVVHMPRGAQVIYPKDLGVIIQELSLLPGMRVLESGVGSGALSMALLRAGVELTGVELREDFARRAEKNLEAFLPPAVRGRMDLRIGDVGEFRSVEPFDRIALDLLDPWNIIPNLWDQLAHDGRIVVYVTNVNQMVETVTALRSAGFVGDTTKEVMERQWVVRGDVVRPEQRMVGHTGYVISAIRGERRTPNEVDPEVVGGAC